MCVSSWGRMGMALGADVGAIRELPGLSTIAFCCEKNNTSPEGCWGFFVVFLCFFGVYIFSLKVFWWFPLNHLSLLVSSRLKYFIAG